MHSGKESPTCYLVGTGSMLTRCGDMLLDAGLGVLGVITEDNEAEAWAIRYSIPQHPYDPDLADKLKCQSFDYLFSIVNFHILPEALIRLARCLCINYHDGPLPRYAGTLTPSWALLQGETDYSVCWHVLDPRVDAGDLLICRSVTIERTDTSLILNAKCHFAGLDAFGELLEQLVSGAYQRTPQPDVGRQFFPRHRHPPGCGLLDFGRGAVELERYCRAFDFGPYEHRWGRPKLLVKSRAGHLDALLLTAVPTIAEPSGPPGRILELTERSIIVAAASGSIAFDGLIDGLGIALTVQEARRRFDLAPGIQLPLPDRRLLHMTNEFQALLVPYESFWTNQLQLPPLEPTIPPASQQPLEKATLTFGETPRDTTMDAWGVAATTAFARFAKRTFQGQALGYAPASLTSELSLLPPLFATVVPLSLAELPESSGEAQVFIRQRLAKLDQRMTFRRDLPLSARVNAPQRAVRYPICVQFGGDSQPCDGALLSLTVDAKDRQLTLWYHPELATLVKPLQQALRNDNSEVPSEIDDGRPTDGAPSILEGERTTYPQTNLYHLLRQRASHDPNATALVFRETVLSYGQLYERTERLAAALWKQGARPGQLVGLYTERCPELVIALLAILRTGAAYLPLDPTYPEERLAFMVNDAEVSLLVNSGQRPAWLSANVAVISLSEVSKQTIVSASDLPFDSPASPSDLAYTIYTSGSTGKPKGVQIQHRAVVNFLYAMAQQPGLDADDTLLAVTSVSFDIAVLEIFLPLVRGARLVLADRTTVGDGRELANLLTRSGATLMQATPATWQMLLAAGWRGDGRLKMLCGGEALSRELAAQLLTKGSSLWNMYGPTEAAVWSTIHAVHDSTKAIPVGRPIANTSIYVLDDQCNLVPCGTMGELCIAGDCLSSGYLKRPELTADRFLERRFADDQPVRIYRTGDLASVTPEGWLIYHGRVDNQVKVRGYRIELEEIEAVLERLPTVGKAVVAVKSRSGTDVTEGSQLVAYLSTSSPSSTFDVRVLRQCIASQLPEYMMPGAFVPVTEFPLTPNGKVDRKALPAPTRQNSLLQGGFSAPVTQLETLLAERWAVLLGLEAVGMDENFFEVGGNSLLVGRLVEELRTRIGQRINPVMIFAYPTVRRLAGALQARIGADTATDPDHTADVPANSTPTSASPTLSGGQRKGSPRNTRQLKTVQLVNSSSTSQHVDTDNESVAIVGMACRFPGADSPEAFFENLCKGVDSVREVPRERRGWYADGHFGDAIHQQGVLDGITNFDYGFFGISAREARRMDPLQRLFIEVAYQAVENAGYSPEALGKQRSGVYVGLIANEYPRLLSGSDVYVDAQTATGNALSLVANRVSYLFNWRGPSMVVDTACSSSLVCLDLAVRAMRTGQLEAALVGGVNLILVPDNTVRFSRAGLLSPDGRCFTFDDRANGYVRGEGVGAVLIKPLARALADGDHIWAVVRGSAVNHDGRNKVGLTAPNLNAQVEVLQQAYEDASCSPTTLGYLEAHGTGTALGDPIEVQALTQFIGLGTRRAAFCAIGSVKSNIGHLEPAAGIAGIIKAALCLRHRTLPPTIQVVKPNRHIAFEETPFYLNDRCRDWPESEHPRRAGISSFGFGGTNAHAILEEAPPISKTTRAERPCFLLSLSAKSRVALDRLVDSYLEYLEHWPQDRITDLCCSASLRRKHFGERLALVVRHTDQLIDKLRLLRASKLVPGDLPRSSIYYGSIPGHGDAVADNAVSEWLGSLPAQVRIRLATCFPDPSLHGYLDPDVKAETEWNESDWTIFYDATARLYAQGLNPDWQAFYEGVAFRSVPLPTYPFEGRHVWADAAERRLAQGLHPLIKSEKATLAGACFELDLEAYQWPLDEHRIQGEPVLPGTALLDLAVYAAQHQLGAKAVQLREVYFNAPLTAQGTDNRSRLLLRRAGESYEVLAYGEEEDNGASETPCFRALVDLVDIVDERLELAVLQQRCDELIEVEDIYEGFERGGLYYGPRFRCLATVTAAGGETLGLVELDDDVGTGFVLHPALADAAFQTALGPLICKRTGDLYVPFFIEAVRCFAPLPRRLCVSARLLSPLDERATPRANISLADDKGRVLAHLEGVTWRNANKSRAAATRWERLINRLRVPSWCDAGPVGATTLRRGRWLIFGDGGALTTGLCEYLTQAQCEPLVLEPGSRLATLAKDRLTISPTRAADYRRLLEILDNDGPPLIGAVHLWSLRHQPSTLSADMSAALDSGLRSCSYLLQALSSARGRQPFVLRAVTAGAAALEGETATADPWAAALSALIRVAAQEQPHLNCAALDLAPDDLNRGAETIAQIVRAVALELDTQGQPELALRPLRSPSRLKPDLRPLSGERALRSRLRTGGVYLITGGSGGIGRKVAAWLATHYRAQVALMSRTPPPTLPEPLATLVRVGHRIAAFTADVADESAVAKAIKRIEGTMGPINGVFHAAGTLCDGLLVNQTEAQLAAVLRPKVGGTVVLERLCKRKNLDFMLLFSSISALEGNVGQAAYAAANRFLDVYAHRCRAQGLPIYSVNWGLWTDAGMGEAFAETARNRGLATLSSAQGLAVIEEVLRRPNAQTGMLEDEDMPQSTTADAPRAGKVVNIDDVRGQAITTPHSDHDVPAGNEMNAPRRALSPVPELAAKATTEQALVVVNEVLGQLLERNAEDVEVDTPLLEMGLDSILAVSGVRALEERTGLKLPPTLLFDYSTAAQLAKALVERYGFNVPGSGGARAKDATSASKATPPRHPHRIPATPPSTVPASPGAGQVTSATASRATGERRRDIAIVGVAGRFPGAADIDELWKLLAAGHNVITEVPSERWDANHYFKPDSNEVGTIYAKWGGFLDNPYDFDAPFFRISPREAEWLDPQQRILLETTWQALENAGYSGTLRGSSTGVFVAASYSHYRDQNVEDHVQTHAGLGNLNAILANRLSYFFDLSGPSLTIDTLCSSSLVALNIAVQNLRAGICEQAVVAGVHVDMSAKYYQMACRLRAFSPTGRCHSFDRRADGFVPGEGCGVVLLKPLESALADGDYIYGVLRGTAVNHGGQSNGLTVPRGSAQAQIVRSALLDAGLTLGGISYIEAHGTGTALGDPIEIAGLTECFNGDTSRKQYCGIGTIKTNIGHLEPAAGIAGLIKVLLCLRAKQLPPSLLSSEINPAIHFEETPFYLNDKLAPWHGVDGVRRAGISSFGMGGVNGHVIIEQAPDHPAAPPNQGERPAHLLVLSARSQSALQALISRHAEVAKRGWPEGITLGDVCHTLAKGRVHFNHRLALVVTEPESVGLQLEQVLSAMNDAAETLPPGAVSHENNRYRRPKLAFLFSGQGAQLPQMGRTLYETEPTFRHHLEHCAAVLDQQLPRRLLEVLYGDEKDRVLIHQTGYAQPALFSLEYALAQLLLSWNIRPDAVIGHSVGEYVAACIAGVFDVDDGLRLIAERARLMQSLAADQGGMLAIRGGRNEVETLLEDYPGLTLAADNGPQSQVVSGSKALLQRFAAAIRERVMTIPLTVSHAFHSPLLEPIAEPLRSIAEGITQRQPELPLVSNLTGAAFEHAPDGTYWARHMLGTVQFAGGMATLERMGIDTLLEIGPQGTLLGLCRQMPAWADAPLLPTLERGRDDWDTLLASVGHLYTRGWNIDWAHFDARFVRRRVPLPNYPFERRTFRAPKKAASVERASPHVVVGPVGLKHPLLDRHVSSTSTKSLAKQR